MRILCGRNTGRLRGLTVVDTVVLSVVLAFLVFGLLMPMHVRAQSESLRDVCAAHLASIGKAMRVYANDYEGKLPRAGGRNSNWAPVNWCALTRSRPGIAGAYGVIASDGTGGNCTISSCFYLLIKYAEVSPKVFPCPEDPCVSEFTLSAEGSNATGITDLIQAWDFGAQPSRHCSYAYHSPWGVYALTTSNDPNMPVAADRNPYIASPGQKAAKTFLNPSDPAIVFAGKVGSEACQKYGNSTVHKGEGQNVLFLDTHVSFKNRPFCGLEDDNIYTVSTFADRGDSMGVIPMTIAPGASPRNRRDSVLVHDPLTWSAPPVRRGTASDPGQRY
jgi:hypothetical protein